MLLIVGGLNWGLVAVAEFDSSPGWPMRAAGISGLVARKRGRTTIRVPAVRVCEDLIDRALLASAPQPA